MSGLRCVCEMCKLDVPVVMAFADNWLHLTVKEKDVSIWFCKPCAIVVAKHIFDREEEKP